MDLQNLTIPQLEEIQNNLSLMRGNLLAKKASEEYSVDSCCAYYERLHGNKVPQYQIDEWLVPIFGMDGLDKGIMIEAFRGSWKTTTISITWGSFYIAHHPERGNLIISSSGPNANQIAEGIKNIIEHTTAWKDCFPNIVPDKKKGWGEMGYEVMRTDIGYDEWAEMNAKRKDPSLLALGVESKTLISKHPDGFLLMDDILDEDNTSSPRQMSGIATKVTGTILPFIVEDDTRPKGHQVITSTIVIGTPWQEDDVYQDLKDTGEFVCSKIPIMIECADGEGVFFDHEKLQGWYKLTDPDKHSKHSIIRLYNRSGHKEFMRMYMLDLSAKIEGEGLTFRTYPHEKINFASTMVCGVDYMSMIREANVDLKNRSYYAQAYLFKLPDGRAVVGDGWYGRPTQGEAELKMEQAEAVYPGHRSTVFEGDGKGEEALQIFLRNPNLTIIPMKTEGKGKPERLEKQLGPWLENGRILISDGDTPFLKFLRQCLRKYPQYFKDPIDAVYWAVRGMPEVLTLEKSNDSLPSIKKKKYENPYYSVGSYNA